MFSRFSVFLVLFAAGALLPGAGCSKRLTPVESGNKTQTLHLGNLDEPIDLDPHIISSHEDHNIIMALMEGLTQYSPVDSTPVPAVAERWDQNEDSTVFTFHLRKNARWSNGDPVTAKDFLYAHRRILLPGLGAEYTTLLYYIKGAEDFHSGALSDFSSVGVKAMDDYTLQYTLRSPVPYFPGIVCNSAYYPVHQATIEKFGKIDQRGTAWTRPGNFVGNGPFNLVEWKQNQVIRVKKSSTYWDRDSVRLQEVNFYPIQSTPSEEAAFRSGQLHVTITLPVDKIQVYRQESSPFLQSETNLATYYFRFNTTRPPLDDPRVRRALALTIDRQQLVERVTKGGQPPAFSITPPNTAGFTSKPNFQYDPPTAQKLLAEAGYPGGKGFPRLELLFNTNEAHRLIAEAIQQMWRKELGIEIGLYNQEAKTWSETMRQMNYQIGRMAWVGDYLDASTFLELFETGNGNNLTGFSNPEYDALLAKARKSGDQNERYACFQRCEEILAEQAPIAPVYFYVHNYLRRPEVKGWYNNLLDFHPLKGVYLEP